MENFNQIKILHYVRQLIVLSENLKRQSPEQRYGTADGIRVLALAIRDELEKCDANTD